MRKREKVHNFHSLKFFILSCSHFFRTVDCLFAHLLLPYDQQEWIRIWAGMRTSETVFTHRPESCNKMTRFFQLSFFINLQDKKYTLVQTMDFYSDAHLLSKIDMRWIIINTSSSTRLSSWLRRHSMNREGITETTKRFFDGLRRYLKICEVLWDE